MTTTPRDHELGAALRALETPEHARTFEADLRRRLAEARLSGEPAVPRSRRSRHRRVAGRVLLVAAFVAVTALAVVPLSDRLAGGSDVATAAEIQAQVRSSLGSLERLSGVLVAGCTEQGCPGRAGERSWRFELASNGDLRFARPTTGERAVYDAAAGVARTALRSESAGGDTIFYTERSGVAPGPPDAGPPSFDELAEFGAFVRALLVARDPRVEEVVYDGRPAWRLEVDAVPNAIVPELTGDRFEIVVDREAGVPVRVVERKGGAVLRDFRVERLEVDAQPSRDLRLAFPAGADILRMDDGFRRVPLGDVAAAVGYAPLEPGWVPEGFALAEVAVAAQAGPTGREAGNPLSRHVVSLSYRRGFDQLVVTTRTAGSGAWSDPVATGEGYLDDPETVVLRRGFAAGASGEVVVVPRGIPHVWTVADGLVVTVAGALGRDELVRVAESLAPRAG
jgi:hypothetical protein